MRFKTGRGPQFDTWYFLERAIIRPNPVMFFRERECDKGNIVWIDGTHQRIGGWRKRRNSFKGNDDHGREQKRQQQIDLIHFETSRTDNLGTMPGELVKGKGRQEKFQIGQEKNASRNGIFNKSGDEDIRIKNQPHVCEALP